MPRGRVDRRSRRGRARRALPGSEQGPRVRAWSRTNEVLAVDAPREIAWRTVPTRTMPDSTEWHIRVEPVEGGGSRIVQSFVVLKLNPIMDRLFYAMTPEHRDRTAALRDDLERLGKVAGELA